MTRPSWIGQTLGGRYRIDDILGQGGMSAVYKAYDPNLKRVVAIKMIHAHLADDPKFVVRFEEEATAVAQLRHPNIVQVFDFNHDNDVYYMVQEFVAGETLQERLRRLNKSNRRMPLNEAIGYMVNICDAAGFAHNRGLVHRDIKPANIMVDIHGQAILMDFGIVKITGGEKHTATGAVVGTALYLPPESIRGETPDSRSDQYSLGVTLFEAVSGRPPYEADSAMTLMMMHLNDPLPDLRQLRPEVPPGLVAVIEKALAKGREQRYASMAEFASALRGVLASLSSAAPAVTLADQPEKPGAVPTQAAIASPITPKPVAPVGPASVPPIPPKSPAGTAQNQSASASVPEPASGTGQSTSPPITPAVQPAPAASPDTASPAQTRPKWILWAGIAGVALIVLIGIAVVLRGLGGSNTPPATTSATTAPAATQAALVVLPTAEPSATPAPSLTPTAALTSPPTATPTTTQSPTPTIPAGVPFSRINAITVNEAGAYVVDYETFEYTEVLPGQHVHFFFNTVPQEQAGEPGGGPWILYGGPRPFEGYRTSDRPQAATQMCIRVANTDHSIQLDSGNCFILPDVNVALPVFADPCLAGPGPAYPAAGQLSAGQVLKVTGISADEAWWTVDSPLEPGQACWLQRSRSEFSGDLSTLPLAETPPLPEGSPAGLSVQIDQISLDDQGRYVIDFTPNDYTPALPGTHMHFFFDIFAADQAGSTGNRLMYGGASPFTGFTQAARPEGATQLCVLVANPDHSVVEGSGNCSPLPDVGTSLSFSTLLNEARLQPVTFQDSFDDNTNNWPTGLSSSAEFGSVDRRIENGWYIWDVNGLEPTVWWAATDKVSALDFHLAATVRQVTGPQTGEYGVIFRKNANQEYLVYKVSDLGRYALYQFKDSAWTALIDWSDTSALLPGEDNRMEVIARGDTVYLALNEELVAQYSPLALGEGQPGLFVGTSGTGETGQWEFDDFEVRLSNQVLPGY